MARAQEKMLEAQDRLSVMPDVNINLDELKSRMNVDLDMNVQQKLSDLDMKLGDMKFDFSALGDMAFLQEAKQALAPPAPPAPPSPKSMRIFVGRGDGEYDAGTRALDQHHYDEAVIRFDQVINSKSSRADGALYWKAYALNRTGKKDEALATLTQLHRDYPQSAWLNDAQALETEVKQSSGQPISPAQESNDDLKLLAINSLMNADPERAGELRAGGDRVHDRVGGDRPLEAAALDMEGRHALRGADQLPPDRGRVGARQTAHLDVPHLHQRRVAKPRVAEPQQHDRGDPAQHRKGPPCAFRDRHAGCSGPSRSKPASPSS